MFSYGNFQQINLNILKFYLNIKNFRTFCLSMNQTRDLSDMQLSEYKCSKSSLKIGLRASSEDFSLEPRRVEKYRLSGMEEPTNAQTAWLTKVSQLIQLQNQKKYFAIAPFIVSCYIQKFYSTFFIFENSTTLGFP